MGILGSKAESGVLDNAEEGLSFGAFFIMLALAILPLFEGGFDHNVIYWALLLLIIAGFVSAIRKNLVFDLKITRPVFWYFLFILWAGASIFWSINPHRSLVELLEISAYGLIFVLITQQNKENLFRIGRMTIIVGVAVALFGISQYLFLDPSRIQSTFANSNPLGIYLVMVFFLGWGFYLRFPNRLLAIGCLVLLSALFLSGSRGAFISGLVSLPFLFLGFKGREKKIPVVKTIICIVVALLITQGIMFSAPYLQEVMGDRHQLRTFLTRPESFIASSGVGRLTFMQVGGKLTAREPFKGYGLGTFYLSYYLEYTQDRWYSRFAHNHYIQTAAELGIIGLLLFLGFLITSFKKTFKVLTNKEIPTYFPGSIAAALAFLIHIGVDFSWNFPAVGVLFFAILGSISGKTEVQEEENPKLIKPFFLFLILLLLLTIWQYTAMVMYDRGVKLDFQGDLTSATRVYEQANTIYPINSMAHSFLSKNYLELANRENDPTYFEKAVLAAKRAVELSPFDGNLHNDLGHLLWRAGKIEEAEKHLSLGVKYAGYRVGLFLDLGMFYFQQEKYNKARDVLENGLRFDEIALSRTQTVFDEANIKSSLFYMHILLTQIYSDKSNQEKSSFHLEKAEEINPDHPFIEQFSRD